MSDIRPRFMTAGDAGAAFAAGKVDAAVTWEPWLTRAKESKDGHILVTSKEKLGLIVDVLLVHGDFARTQPEAVKGVLRAWFDAVDYCTKNPVEANAIMAKGLGLAVEEFVDMLMGNKLSDYQENRRYFGVDSPEPGPYVDVFQGAQSIWLREGLIEKRVDPEDVIDVSFLRDLYN